MLLISLDLMRRVVKFIYEHTGFVVWKLYGRVLYKLDDHSRRFRQGLSRSREATALRQPTEMDSPALSWTLDALGEDHELEQFVAAIPGYYRSTTIQPPRGIRPSRKPSSCHQVSLRPSSLSSSHRQLSFLCCASPSILIDDHHERSSKAKHVYHRTGKESNDEGQRT